jgi:enterochelin esterase family protein
MDKARMSAVALAAIMAGMAAPAALAQLAGAPGPARKPGDYPLTAESLVDPAIAHGQLLGPFEHKSQVFAGTVRRYWVYLPAGYRAEAPAPNLLVFQDGQRATNPEGSLRIPNVLDNLIAKGDLPPTIGLFVTPGNLSDRYPDNLGSGNPDHRWQEYDELDDDYSQMLLSELLPHVAKNWRFTDDPARRAIGGTSSGAIAAFTVAWRHPEAFGNVLSMIGSYTAIAAQYSDPAGPPVPAGDLYPRFIRLSPPKKLRIFLQDGANDLDNEHGNWFLANQSMLAAFGYANRRADAKGDANDNRGPRYEVAHVWGDGAHNDQHGGSLLPEMLRWIWRKPK